MPKAGKIDSLLAASFPVRHNYRKLYQFTTGINHINGHKGWKPLTIKGFDPVPSVMIVHDIMEHFPGDEGGVHNEYQAQGAMFWLRHETGYFQDRGLGDTASAVVRPAFGMLFSHISKKSLHTKIPPLNDLIRPLDNSDTDIEMQGLVRNAMNLIEGSYPTHRKILRESMVHCVPWMRIGYRRAASRYRGLNKNKLIKLFNAIQDSLEGNLGKITEGAKLNLTCNYTRYEANLEFAAHIKV